MQPFAVKAPASSQEHIQPSQQRHIPGITREVAQQRIAAQPLYSGVTKFDRAIEPAPARLGL